MLLPDQYDRYPSFAQADNSRQDQETNPQGLPTSGNHHHLFAHNPYTLVETAKRLLY
jgi:hypothetical protein